MVVYRVDRLDFDGQLVESYGLFLHEDRARQLAAEVRQEFVDREEDRVYVRRVSVSEEECQ